MKTKINIEQIREDKIKISITLPHSYTREFTIYINENGLKISGETTITVIPHATNIILVDQI